MEKDFFLIHKLFFENFWDDFSERLSLRQSDEEVNDLFLFELNIQKLKLNRYKDELEPDKYLDHQNAYNEQKSIVEGLEKYYKIFKNPSKKPFDRSKELEECKKSNSITQEGASYNLDKLTFHFKDEYFSANTLEKDIRKVFSFPLEQPHSPLKLKVNNKVFVFLLLEMQNANILETGNLFKIIEELACFRSERGTILKRSNLDGAKSQLKATPLAEQTEKSIRETVRKIKI